MIVNPNTLNLDSIIDVEVLISPLSAPRATFNQLLVVGSSLIIPVDERVRVYTNPADMLTDGFSISSLEYLAALLYFGQSPSPEYLWVGMIDPTVLKTIAINARGTGYAVNDVLSVVQAGGSGGKAKVTAITNDAITAANVTSGQEGTGYSVDDILTVINGTVHATFKVLTINAGAVATIKLLTAGSVCTVANGNSTTVSPSGGTGCKIDITEIGDGVISTIELFDDGTGYTPETNKSTTVLPAGGTGATIDISAIGETELIALMNCRSINYEWYVAMIASDSVTKAMHESIALWAQSAIPSSVYAFTTDDDDIPTGVAGNVFAELKALSYNRIIGQYSTDNILAIAAIMGYAMGQNSGLDNSAFTLKFKGEVGVMTEAVTPTIKNVIEGNNGNLYLSYGNFYNIFEQGVMANGQFFDEIINLDMLVNDIQLSVMDLLYQNPKVPQTDAGVTQIIHTINQACEKAVERGFLAPGQWTGMNILNLKTDDTLPKGYLVQAPKIATQSRADREARKSPPIYVSIKEAGAIHSVTIGVYVNR